jgi:type II secretory pathway pseudopilin PulG
VNRFPAKPSPTLSHSVESRLGLSLPECLVVISLVTVLMALLVPAIGAARERARDIRCQHGLRQCLLTMHQIASDTGKLPEGVSRPWTRTVLKQVDATLRDDDTKLTSSGREMFVCPAAPKSLAVAEEVSNRGMNAETTDKLLESISDGTSHTILIGELSSLTSIAWDIEPCDLERSWRKPRLGCKNFF